MANDSTYLREKQYKDSSNLKARIAIHERFSQNKANWHRWVFDHIQAPPQAKVLELGSGPAQLWTNNQDRLPDDWQVILSDFSAGMVQEEQQKFDSYPNFTFQVIDAQKIPFPDATFDIVIANHMLYHVPNLSKALAEISRVLKPAGHLYAATNGKNHIHEIDELLQEFIPDQDRWGLSNENFFTLENGEAYLSPYFSAVKLHNFEDALHITETEPLIGYILSGRASEKLSEEQVAKLRQHIQKEIDEKGVYYVTKATGLFETNK
jgi:ubiquinone/menaquinone biosynthesis C-methylase UbiE